MHMGKIGHSVGTSQVNQIVHAVFRVDIGQVLPKRLSAFSLPRKNFPIANAPGDAALQTPRDVYIFLIGHWA
ncbi:hypothetical protein CCGE525_34785 (plasmid) [Rhizobium jaguaris]|uniref:Uncharacterized protein n=1 Tax=Rhizobium jaguaris TaxID=1312183 RepID=A0A387FZ93_9HYPH|nr:hypothetical protein CCGE525_34785 [Rhizobium jaguaris]